MVIMVSDLYAHIMKCHQDLHFLFFIHFVTVLVLDCLGLPCDVDYRKDNV